MRSAGVWLPPPWSRATPPKEPAAPSPPPTGPPPRPWLRVQGTSDASTMWYAVMRRREKGVHIGTLVLRHSAHHTLLLERGWEEVAISEIAAPSSQAM